nr:hypothetical protein [Armatimonas rosea]
MCSPRQAGVRGQLPLLALLGPHDWLPWSPGVLYLAPEPLVPTLYLPTTQRPTLPPALVLAALTRRFPELRPPLALLPTCCFSLAEAGALASLQTSLPPAPSLPLRPDFVGGKGGGVRGGGFPLDTPPPRPSAPPLPLLPRNVEKEGEGVAE